jgi:hypothetical protein
MLQKREKIRMTKNSGWPDLHCRVPLFGQSLEIFAGLDPDCHGLVAIPLNFISSSLTLTQKS